jgi:hypothetical protein
MKRRTLLLSLVTVLLTVSCKVTPQEKPIRVLFIGNSYTQVNNLPEVFAALARAGHHAVDTRMVAPGGWALKDHWDKGDAHSALLDGHWNYVVLQEQSMLNNVVPVDGQPHVGSDAVFRPYAEKWAAEARRAGTTPVFYLTWARKLSPGDQASLNDAYVRAARDTGSALAPVGMAWARTRGEKPALELFQQDGSHPSPAGTYLAACTLYATIFHNSPQGLPNLDLSPDDARYLQSAAWSAWENLEK